MILFKNTLCKNFKIQKNITHKSCFINSNFVVLFIFVLLVFNSNNYGQLNDNLNYQNKRNQNQFEIKAGYEIKRRIPEAILGYNIIINNNLSFTPEFSYLCGIIPSLSIRLSHQLFRGNFFAQVGGGYLITVGKAAIIGCGVEFNLTKKIKLQTEIRILLVENNKETTSLEIENFNIVKNKPLIISLGVCL